ncbi:zinc ribbon domain-containing protein [Thiomonas bhubaneswarensis]|uniref:Zinc-ribbon domain n=1 Tax=Thiomonas bhubaneswarensis TaxID=339866 RepID=A0A0K6HU84_9BURK|nr:zinc ribbon domain-containing protein [Thiomonas bhubaneswarensis]CUA94338.1 zinc-ribbon domain [Thiomonas bhubaneswarensis]
MTVKTTNNLGVLLRSYEALHNWRALAMLAGSFVLGGLAISGGAAAGMSSGSPAVTALMSLLGAIIIIVGMNASGLMLVDQAYDQPIRGFAPAFLGGVQSALYVIGLLILLGLSFAVVLLAAFLLSLFGRIPGIGGLFGFLLGGPLVVVVALAYAVLLLAGPLMIAAVWHGEGFVASLSRAVGIVARRPLEVFMHFLVLGLLVFPAVAFIFAVVFVGSMFVGGFFAAGSFGGMGMGWGGMGGWGGMRGMEGVALGGAGMGGAGLSISLVWFLAWAVVSLIYVLGMIFVYRAVGEGVGSEATDVVNQKLAQFKQKLDEYKPRPAPAAPAAAEPAPPPPEVGPNATPDAALQCPACHASVQPDDVFCGNCGHRLKEADRHVGE